MRLRVRAPLGLIFAALLVTPCWAVVDLKAMRPFEIEALQRRLTDAGCYHSIIDGKESAATGVALRSCPDQSPMLRIETGMHVAPINRIQTSPDCRTIVTASDDGSIRLWSETFDKNIHGVDRLLEPSVSLLRTIRLPLNSMNRDGRSIIALSPDSKSIALFGASKADGNVLNVHILDVATGTMIGTGNIDKKDVNELEFSKDGSQIGIGTNFSGIKVLSIIDGHEIFADRNYNGPIGGLSFGYNKSSGVFMITTSYDGYIRYYNSNNTLIFKTKSPDGNRPSRITITSDGSFIAVSYDDTNHISIFKTQGWEYLGQAIVDGLNIKRNAVTAALALGQPPIGHYERLLVAGGARGNSVFRFNEDVTSQDKLIQPAGDKVEDFTSCSKGVFFASKDAKFGFIDTDGRYKVLGESVSVDMEAKTGSALTVNDSSTSVRIGLGRGEVTPVIFDLSAGRLIDAPTMPSDFHAAETNSLDVGGWHDDNTPNFGGITLPLAGLSVSHALAIPSDKNGFVLGGDQLLRTFDAAGHQIWQNKNINVVTGVNLSKDGRIIVATYNDGTIRWFRWSDGQELLALFIHAPTKRWVAWTPSGYYMASPGAEDLIGWQVNRGWEQEADFFPASRFRNRFNRPDVVQGVLKTIDEGESLRQADSAAHQRPNDAKPLIEHLPPVVNILSPAEGASIAQGTVEIRYRTRLPSGGTVERIEAFVDGAKITARGLAPVAEQDDSDGSGHITLPMPAHNVVISLVAYAGGLSSDAARVELKGIAPAVVDSRDALKPSLYALLVGVTHYQNHSLDLEYAAADAVDLAAALKAQEGKLYRHVEVRILTDKNATSTDFKRGLNWLSKQTTARDLAVVFASGHGLTDAKGKFWFLTEEAEPDDLLATAVSQEDLSNALFDLPGKKLILLDACHSGAALSTNGIKGLQPVDVGSAVNDFAQAEGGTVAYAASTGREVSLERPEWGHGAFTKALIEGFSGKADLLHNGTVTTATLDAYLEDRVKELTGGLQHPVMNRPKTVPDFPIASLQ